MKIRSALERRRLKRRERGGGVSTTGLTPLVDVVFLLLLFLVLTARFIPKENRFDLKLPESQPPNVEKYLEPFRLEVRAAPGTTHGAVLYAGGEQVLSAGALLERLRGLPEQIPVVVSGDDQVPYAAVVNAYDACLAAGRKRIVLSVADEAGSS